MADSLECPLEDGHRAETSILGWNLHIIRFIQILLLCFLHGSSLQSAAAWARGQAGEIPSVDRGIPVNLDPALRFELEEALQENDYPRAEQLIINEIEHNPNGPKHALLTYLGGLFFVDGKYLNCAVAYKKAEAIRPIDPGNRFTMAMAYVMLGQPDWALPELKQLIAAEPSQPLYRYWLARLYFDKADYATAIVHLEKVVEVDAGYVRAHDRLGLSYQALDRNEEAVEHFRTAVSWNRRSAEASVWPPLNLGVLLMQMGRLEEADNFLQEAVRVDSGFAPAHYQLGLVLEKRDKLKESIRSLRTATKLKSDYADPYWALTRVLRLAGDRKGAEAALQQYLDLKREP